MDTSWLDFYGTGVEIFLLYLRSLPRKTLRGKDFCLFVCFIWKTLTSVLGRNSHLRVKNLSSEEKIPLTLRLSPSTGI